MAFSSMCGMLWMPSVCTTVLTHSCTAVDDWQFYDMHTSVTCICFYVNWQSNNGNCLWFGYIVSCSSLSRTLDKSLLSAADCLVYSAIRTSSSVATNNVVGSFMQCCGSCWHGDSSWWGAVTQSVLLTAFHCTGGCWLYMTPHLTYLTAILIMAPRHTDTLCITVCTYATPIGIDLWKILRWLESPRVVGSGERLSHH